MASVERYVQFMRITTIRRQPDKSGSCGLLNGDIGYYRGDCSSGDAVHVNRQVSVLVRIIEGDGHVIGSLVACCNGLDGIKRTRYFRLSRRSHEYLVQFRTSLCACEVELIFMGSRSVPTISEIEAFFGISGSSRYMVCRATYFLNNQVMPLTIFKRGSFYFHRIITVSARIGQNGSSDGINLRAVRCNERNIVLVTVFCITEAECISVLFTIRRQVVNLYEINRFTHL